MCRCSYQCKCLEHKINSYVLCHYAPLDYMMTLLGFQFANNSQNWIFKNGIKGIITWNLYSDHGIQIPKKPHEKSLNVKKASWDNIWAYQTFSRDSRNLDSFCVKRRRVAETFLTWQSPWKNELGINHAPQNWKGSNKCLNQRRKKKENRHQYLQEDRFTVHYTTLYYH